MPLGTPHNCKLTQGCPTFSLRWPTGPSPCSVKCSASCATVFASAVRQQRRGRAAQFWTAARITDEDEDTLLWDQPSGSKTQVGSSSEAEALEEKIVAIDYDSSADEEQGNGTELSDERGWDQALSKEEQLRMDREAREFAYGFGSNQARDLVTSRVEGFMGDEGDEDDESPVEPAGKGKGKKKSRKRKERRSGRPKDTSIPLHMLPKVLVAPFF